jgi:hypothetical protein
MPLIDLTRGPKRARRRAQRQHRGDAPHVSAFAPKDEVSVATERRGSAAAKGALGEKMPAVREEEGGPEPTTGAAEWGSPLGRRTSSRSSSVSSLDTSDDDEEEGAAPREKKEEKHERGRSVLPKIVRGSSSSSSGSSGSDDGPEADLRRRERLMRSRSTIRGEYAVLPAGLAWDDWSEEERRELDDHVRHLMHSRRERWRRRLRGFGKFVRRRESRFQGSVLLVIVVLIVCLSGGIPHHAVRVPHHVLGCGLGALPHRVDLRRRAQEVLCRDRGPDPDCALLRRRQ